jgi:hypothetical protein
MSESELFKIESQLELNALYISSATRIQKWWKEKLRKWKITYAPDIKRWKASIKIQKWFKSLKTRWAWRLVCSIRNRAAIKI